jgi:hypothetical protein
MIIALLSVVDVQASVRSREGNIRGRGTWKLRPEAFSAAINGNRYHGH